MQTSDYQNVNLGSGKDKATKVLMMIEDGGAVFDKPGATKIDKNGSFAIQTSGYDMSKYGKHNTPLPSDLLISLSRACVLRPRNEEPNS